MSPRHRAALAESSLWFPRTWHCATGQEGAWPQVTLFRLPVIHPLPLCVAGLTLSHVQLMLAQCG